MKTYLALYLKILIVSVASISWSSAQTLGKFSQGGIIDRLDSSSVNLGHREYRLTPNIKVAIPGKERAILNQLKVGDSVALKGFILDGVYYVESITYHQASGT